MTHRRPPAHIRVVALGLHWRAGALLVAEVPDDDGSLKGLRPLGGGVEFGETWEQALRREFREELGVGIEITSPPLVMENLFEHRGALGHEIIFVADVRFEEGAFAGVDEITFEEHDGTPCRARWVPLGALDEAGPPLFPTGLKARLLARL